MLILDAIRGMFCCYANLRMMSDYPSIIQKIHNKQRESMCPFNKDFVGIKTKLFINYSDRVKHKIERKFFSIRNKSEDLAFYRKFCKKTTIDVSSEVRYWVEKNALLNHELWALYTNSSTKHAVFKIKNINRIRCLLKDYKYVQSLQVTEVLSILKTRIVQKNLPCSIEKLQCILVESFCISVLAVLKISKSNKVRILVVKDKDSFTLSRKQKKYYFQESKEIWYSTFNKSSKIKRDLRSKNMLLGNLNAAIKTSRIPNIVNFRFTLLQHCNFEAITKNYKSINVKHAWVKTSFVNKYHLTGIFVIQDRILQQIIIWAMLPIHEAQADSFSLRFRSGKSIFQEVVYILRKLLESKIIWGRSAYLSQKVSKERFSAFKGKKYKCRSFKIFKDSSKNKRQLSYLRVYWIYSGRIRKRQYFKFHSQYRYLNVSLMKYFNQISYNTLHQKIPLASKYLFLIEIWWTREVIGSEFNEVKRLELRLTSKISQGSIISSFICRIVLNDLQEFMRENLPSRYAKSLEELRHIKFKSSLKLSRSVNWAHVRFFCVKYFDSILILAKCLKVHIKNLQELLVVFLDKMNLSIKSPLTFRGNFLKYDFSLKYLGFNFSCLDPNKFCFNKKRSISINVTTVKSIKSFKSALAPFVQKRLFYKIKMKLKTQLNVINSYLSPGVMIDKLNSILMKASNYYHFICITTKQLSRLNDLLYRFFYKYLVRKFISKPKLHTFISKIFWKDGRFSAENKTLRRVTDFKRLNLSVFTCTEPENFVFNGDIISNAVSQKVAIWSYRRRFLVSKIAASIVQMPKIYREKVVKKNIFQL